MAGTKVTRFVQFGNEATAGTEVNATVLWVGNGQLKDSRTISMFEASTGNIMPDDNTFTVMELGEFTLEETPATYEQLPCILDAAIKEVSGAADGAGSDYIYAYPFPTASTANTTATLTIEEGDVQQAYLGLYGYPEQIVIQGSAENAVTVAGDFKTRTVAKTTKTAGLTVPTIEAIIFSKSTLYIDTAYGSWGSTAKASTLLGFTLTLNTGLKAKRTANGELYFDFIYQDAIMPELTLILEHNATGVAELDAYRAETPQYIRIKTEGSAFGTGGTTYSNHTLIIDLYGKFTDFEALGDDDGNSIVTGTFNAMLDEANTDAGQIVVVNEVADVWA